MSNAIELWVTHAGWSRLEAESGRSVRAAHEAGWRHHLESLKNYAERVAGP